MKETPHEILVDAEGFSRDYATLDFAAGGVRA